ncbi:MAG: ATPase [Halopseudomonas sp.]
MVDRKMQAETYEQLIEWTGALHRNLAERLEQGLAGEPGEKAKWLLEYLADHERKLNDVVSKVSKHGNAGALHTWLYEHLSEKLPADKRQTLSFVGMSFEDISDEIFVIHNQLLDLYRSAAGRAPTPEVRELMEELLELEEHETLRLAKQVDSVRAM